MPFFHQLATVVSVLQLLLALRIVSCSRAPQPAPPSSDADAVTYSFPAFDNQTEHGLVVATTTSILSPASFLFDAQLFPEFNTSEGFVLLSQPVQLWGAADNTSSGTEVTTREASFNTSFKVDAGGSPVAFVVLLDSFPPLATPGAGLRGTNGSSTFTGGGAATLNVSDSLAVVEVGAVGSYGPESQDVGLNVTVAPNSTSPRCAVWIEYNAVVHHLWVYVAAAGEPRPPKALVDVPLNLTGHRTTQSAFVGFFAAPVRDVIHGVKNWELRVDKFPSSDDGDGEHSRMLTSWLLILIAVLGSVAVAVGIVSVVVCYTLSRRRVHEMEQIMKQSYPHPTRRGVRP